MTRVAQPGARPAKQKTKQTTVKLSNGFLIALLMLSFVMPFFFFVGGFKLSIYRLYLILAAFPVFICWLNGTAGKIRIPDILIAIAALWMASALFINHGVAAQWEFAGILVVETIVPYLIARVLIRDFIAFRTFVWWLFAVIMALLPFALYENLTGKPVLLDLFRGIFKVYHNVNQEPRLGLERAQASMPHPILFGVFCAPAFALSWYVLSPEGSFFRQIRRPFVVGTAVFSSLSSGAFMGVLLQAFLIAWDEMLKTVRKRWKLFVIVFGTLFVFLELASNRNVFQIVATELTFSKGSAWNRIHIFNNAIDDVFRNPVFGIGFGYWTRPSWLRPSVDNFWLLVALRYGLPALFLFAMAAIMICWNVGRSSLEGVHARARTGYLISFISLGVSASTVHLWEAAYCLFMFLLGSGVWFMDADGMKDAGQDSKEPAPSRREIRYTRFSDTQPAENLRSGSVPDTRISR